MCPDTVDQVIDDVVDEVRQTAAALPAATSRLLPVGLLLIDQLTRATPEGRGRPLHRLERADARVVLEAAMSGRSVVPAQLVLPFRSLAVAAYYDHPAVRLSLGYTPEAWIEQVTARRLRDYAGELE